PGALTSNTPRPLIVIGAFTWNCQPTLLKEPVPNSWMFDANSTPIVLASATDAIVSSTPIPTMVPRQPENVIRPPGEGVRSVAKPRCTQEGFPHKPRKQACF